MVVSNGIGRWLSKQGVDDALVSLNGIPDALLDTPPGGASDFGVLRYVGEFYLSRDPEPVFAALGRLQSRGVIPAGFRIELIGDVEHAVHGTTRELLRATGLTDRASLSPRIPHAEALDRIRRAGAVLLLAQGQPDQIPNKLYEYLGARRPILAVVDHGGESHQLLQRAGQDALVLTERSSPAEWDRVVAAAVAASFTTPAVGGASLDELRTSRQLSRVVAACEELLLSE